MNSRRRRPLVPLALLSLALLLVAPPAARAQSQAAAPTLEQLRADYAVRFLEPGAHMALARHYRDKGDPLMAFLILEAARRNYFERKDFDAAFKTHFLGEKPFDNGPAAEARLLSELSKNPNSFDALHGLADIYISREDYAKGREYLRKAVALRPDDFGETEALAEVLRREDKDEEAAKLLADWALKHPETAAAYAVRISQLPETDIARAAALLAEAAAKFPKDARFPFGLAVARHNEGDLKEAERLYVRAAELAPDSANIQTWVGRFFFKAREDDRRALGYYLKAYLLDPHAYETEHVESRIPNIGIKLAAARLKELRGQGVSLGKIAEDPDPYVAAAALKRMREQWRPEYAEPAVRLMAHDDPTLRATAMVLLKEKADPSFDERLKALLSDPDLRRRGLAAYLAVNRRKAASFDAMRAMLREKAQLLRYDAISALLMEGGAEGRRVALQHRPHEKHPRLKSMLNHAAGEKIR